VPEDGDTVIELVGGVPHVYEQTTANEQAVARMRQATPANGQPGVKGLFHEDQHPRGHDGKWIEVGHDVTLPGGLHGKVTSMHGGQVVVEAADGTHRVIPAGQVTSNGPAARGGFHAMHAPVGVPAGVGEAGRTAALRDHLVTQHDTRSSMALSPHLKEDDLDWLHRAGHGEGSATGIVAPGKLAAGHRLDAAGHIVHTPADVPAAHGQPHGRVPWTHAGDTAHFHGSLGIDRGDMPQLSGTAHGKYVPSSVMVPRFMGRMRAKGVPVTHEHVPAESLKPAQATGDVKAIRGIADSVKAGADTKPVIASADSWVLDGHHTWAGHVLAGKEASPGVNVTRVGLPIRQLIGEARAFGDTEGIARRKTGVSANPEHAPAAPLTDAEYEARRKMVESKLNAELAAGHATDRAHTIGGNGEVYTPDRAAQHKQIIDDIMKRHEHVPNEGKGVMAGGLGGAGKSTVLGKHAGIDTSKYMTLNPDDVKEEMAKRGMIPHVDGLSPMEASPLAHEEASHITNLAAKRAYEKKKNLIWDITMSSPKSAAKRVDDMRKAGYGHVRGVFVDIPAEISVARALARHRRGLEDYRAGKGNGGRYVPPDLIRKSAGTGPKSANRQAFETVRPKFSQWDVYDNSVHGRPPQLVERSHR
jgi:hypothetical protein